MFSSDVEQSVADTSKLSSSSSSKSWSTSLIELATLSSSSLSKALVLPAIISDKLGIEFFFGLPLGLVGASALPSFRTYRRN
jgi:hypothetical protein